MTPRDAVIAWGAYLTGGSDNLGLAMEAELTLIVFTNVGIHELSRLQDNGPLVQRMVNWALKRGVRL